MKHFLLAILIGVLCGCGTDGEADKDGKTPTTSQSHPDAKVESQVLMAEMRKMIIESLAAKSPDASASEIETQADAVLDTEVKEMRSQDPDFLIVTAACEEDLKNNRGNPETDADIQAARKKFEEFAMEVPGATKKLLADYEAKTLSPVRKELLRELLELSEKKLEQDLR